MHPGELIDERFQIERQTWMIGLASIYRARDLASGDPVAVKVLTCEMGDAARVVREGEILARLLGERHHPGIVRYVAHGMAAPGMPYVVTEWLEGEDLSSRLQRQELSVNETITIGVRAAEALAAVHACGVVHRDIKPHNLFLVDGDLAQVKLLDFELAWLSDATRITATGRVIGTPAYMAPERLRGEPMDAPMDVFSLGCVLFECLTGTPAFTGEHIIAILKKVLLDPPPRPRSVRPSSPSGSSSRPAPEPGAPRRRAPCYHAVTTGL